MLRICQVCGEIVPPGTAICPTDGSDEKSFLPILVEMTSDGLCFRVKECPFDLGREWVKQQFKHVRCPEGHMVYQYLPRSEAAPARVEVSDRGFVITSDLVADENVNHWRINGVPVGAPGVVLEEDGQVLELWSKSQKKVIWTLQISFWKG
jgi:hypothetical protein